jgi:hypothetical protein
MRAGVPLTIPVEGSRVSPGGNAGETEYEATVPPLLVGAFGAIALPLV